MHVSDYANLLGIVTMVHSYGWNRIAVVRDDSFWASTSYETFRQLLKSNHPRCDIINANDEAYSLAALLSGGLAPETVLRPVAALNARIIILITPPRAQQQILAASYTEGLLYGEGHVWISAQVSKTMFYDAQGRVSYDTIQGAKGMLGFVNKDATLGSSVVAAYTRMWRAVGSQAACDANFIETGPFCDSDGDTSSVPTTAYAHIDSIIALARAVHAISESSRATGRSVGGGGGGGGGAKQPPTAKGSAGVPMSASSGGKKPKKGDGGTRQQRSESHTSSTEIYKGLLSLGLWEGISGKDIMLDPLTGDRVADLQFVNMQVYNSDATSKNRRRDTHQAANVGRETGRGGDRERRAVQVATLETDFRVVGSFNYKAFVITKMEAAKKQMAAEGQGNQSFANAFLDALASTSTSAGVDLDVADGSFTIVFAGGTGSVPSDGAAEVEALFRLLDDDTNVTTAGTRSAAPQTVAWYQVFIVIAAVLALMAIFYCLHIRQLQRHKALVAHDFKRDIGILVDAGEIDAKGASTKIPREIKRTSVELITKLGSGAFGEVHKAMLDESHQRGAHRVPAYLVAAKVIKSSHGAGALSATNDLIFEAALMAQVGHHPHLVALVGVVTKGSPKMLLSSYCEHGDLKAYLKKMAAFRDERMEVDGGTKLRYLLDIATGMEFLTARKFVHRDLAARNVLLSSSLACQVADFGLSRGMGDGDSGEYYSCKQGTFPIRWTAPDVITSMKYTSYSDVWSFGIVGIEVFTDGKVPYSDLSTLEVIEHVKSGRKCPRPELCPPSLYEVLAQCWSLEPSQRPDFATILTMLKKQKGKVATFVRPSFGQQTTVGFPDVVVEDVKDGTSACSTVVAKPTCDRQEANDRAGGGAPAADGSGSVDGGGSGGHGGGSGGHHGHATKHNGLPPTLRQARSRQSEPKVTPDEWSKEVYRKFQVKRPVTLMSEEHMPGKAHIDELFFDLIFVASMYRLGNMLVQGFDYQQEDTAIRDACVLFAILWLLFHHFNMVKTRFMFSNPWWVLEYIILILTMLVGLTMCKYAKGNCLDAVATTTTTTTVAPISTTFGLDLDVLGTTQAAAVSTASSPSDSADTSCSEHEYVIVSALTSSRFQLVWASLKMVYALTYTLAIASNKKVKASGKIYASFFFMSAIVSFVAAGVNDGDVTLALTGVAILLELLIEACILVAVEHSDMLPIDVHHNVERAELWAVLVIGEALLSLVQGSGPYYYYYSDESYVHIVLGFTIMLALLQLFAKSGPAEGQEMDSHAYDSSLLGSIAFDFFHLAFSLGTFGTGVALKFVAKYGNYYSGKKYTQDHAWLLTGSIALTVIACCLSRFCHEWTDYSVCHSAITRKRLWLAHVVVGICIIPTAVLIKASKDADTGYYEAKDGSGATEFLCLILALLGIPLVLDFVSVVPESVLQSLEVFKQAKELLTSGHCPLPDDEGPSMYSSEYMKDVGATATASNKMGTVGGKQFRFSSSTVIKAMCQSRNLAPFNPSARLEGSTSLNVPHDANDLLTNYLSVIQDEEPHSVLGEIMSNYSTPTPYVEPVHISAQGAGASKPSLAQEQLIASEILKNWRSAKGHPVHGSVKLWKAFAAKRKKDKRAANFDFNFTAPALAARRPVAVAHNQVGPAPPMNMRNSDV